MSTPDLPRPRRSPEAAALETFLAATLAITPMTTNELDDATTAAGLYRPGRVETCVARLEHAGQVRGLHLDAGPVLWAPTATALPAPDRRQDRP